MNITKIYPDSKKKFLSLNYTLALLNSNLAEGLINVNSMFVFDVLFGLNLISTSSLSLARTGF